MSTYVFGGGLNALREIAEVHAAGGIAVCGVCGAEMKVALSFDEAREKGIHPGAYCSADPAHPFISVHLKR